MPVCIDCLPKAFCFAACFISNWLFAHATNVLVIPLNLNNSIEPDEKFAGICLSINLLNEENKTNRVHPVRGAVKAVSHYIHVSSKIETTLTAKFIQENNNSQRSAKFLVIVCVL